MPFSKVFDTGLHADCVRFVPTELEPKLPYFHVTNLKRRRENVFGKLILAENTMEREEVRVIEEVTDIPGVFEFTWFKGDSNLLATALATGPPRLFKYNGANLVPVEIQTEGFDDLEMTLAVAGEPECFVTCDNKGNLQQWNLNNATLEMNQEWNGHDAEIWYVSQDKHNGNLFYSGSDDYSMKCWDIRCASSAAQLVAANKSDHEAGVCCVVSESVGWMHVGIRVIWRESKIVGQTGIPVATRLNRLNAEVELGGGLESTKSNEIAVAAMRAGFHVINLNENGILRQKMLMIM